MQNMTNLIQLSFHKQLIKIKHLRLIVSLFLVVCFLNRNNTLVEHCSKSKDHLNYLIMKKIIYFRAIVDFAAIRFCNKVKKTATDEVQ